jgi:WD40 repeat protein
MPQTPVAPLTCPATTPVWSAAIGQLVNSVAISDDAAGLVAATYYHVYKGYGGNPDYGVYYFKSASSTPVWTWPLQTTTEGAYWVAMSGDGAYAAAGGLLSNGTIQNGFLQAYDLASGAVVLDYTLPTASRINKVALSQDGRVLVAVAGPGLYYSTLTGGTYSTPVPMNDSPQTVAISGDGQWIVTGSYGGTVMLFSAASGTPTQVAMTTARGGANVRCVSITRDGLWFAIAGGATSTGGVFSLYATQQFAAASTPAPLWEKTATGAVYYVALANPSPDSPVVAGVSNVPWPTPEGTPPQSSTAGGVQVIYTDASAMPQVSYTFETLQAPNSASMDGSAHYLAIADGYGTTSDGHFYLIDLFARSCAWAYETEKMSWPIAVSFDGTGIAAGSDDSSVYYFTP